MRFLIDENAPLAIPTALSGKGHDVSRSSLGATDLQVLAQARGEKRILVTFDRDFGELIIRRGAPAPLGVIYLRPRRDSSPADAAELVTLLVASGLRIEGNLTVIDRGKPRQRPLPRKSR